VSGRVFKRCSRCGARVKQRKCHKCDGTSFNWAFRAYVAKNAQGRWIEQFRSGFPSRREAERALHELLTSLQRGPYVETSKMTLAQFLREEWLPATAPPRVKFETWNDRKRNLEIYVIPSIGGIVLQDLNAAHLNRLYTELLREGRVHH
jgi:integrase